MVAGVMAGAYLAATAILPVSAPWLWIAADLERRETDMAPELPSPTAP